MKYNPEDPSSRRHLAVCIEKTLVDAGFFEEWHGDEHDPTKERTFTREIVPGIRVIVYTTIVGDTCRKVGKDAIRVCALYRSERLGKERGIVSETRVHRTGDTDAICNRLLERMRKVWKAGRRPCRCHQCNAPTFKSKAGNDVCADLCWKPVEDLESETRRSYRRW